jgi:hypothetical protein
VQALGRARRRADEQREKTGRERIERAAVADPSLAQDAANDSDDIERGPTLGFIDREDAVGGGLGTLAPLAATLAPLAERGPLPLGPLPLGRLPPGQAIPSATG